MILLWFVYPVGGLITEFYSRIYHWNFLRPRNEDAAIALGFKRPNVLFVTILGFALWTTFFEHYASCFAGSFLSLTKVCVAFMYVFGIIGGIGLMHEAIFPCPLFWWQFIAIQLCLFLLNETKPLISIMCHSKIVYQYHLGLFITN